MFVLLRELQRLLTLPVTENSPAWSGLVKAIRALPSHPFTDRVDGVIRGAERRGRLRNNFIHASWYQASDETFVARRPFAQKGQGTAMLIMSRAVLDNDVEMMETFAGAVEDLAAEVQGFRT